MNMHKRLWRRANSRLIPSGILFVVGAAISTNYGKIHGGDAGRVFIALFGMLIFVGFALVFLHVLTDTLRRVLTPHLGAARAATVQFIQRTIGYVIIGLMTLNLLSIPVGKLLVGGAVVGIILGVAAQQALANFFASVMLIITRPYGVGDSVIFMSGALGGKYEGTIIDIGLTHTHLEEASGDIIMLPNATLLSGATIRASKKRSKASVDSEDAPSSHTV